MRLVVDSLCQGYGPVEVLQDVSFSTETGEILALLGPNGSGKSTLIKTMCDVIPPLSGEISVDGVNIMSMGLSERAKVISYVPQSCRPAPFTTVVDTVLIGRRPYMGWSYSEEDIDIAIDCMKIMKIQDLSRRFISELSGGQMQRVFLARSLAQRPSFYLFDEPTSSLDLKHQMETMMSMKREMGRHNSGMIIALHDLNLALNYADKVMLLKDKHIYAFGDPKAILTEDAIRDVYGVESCIVKNEFGKFILPYVPANAFEGIKDDLME